MGPSTTKYGGIETLAIPNRSTSKEIIVIGYGSSLRSDDAAGARAAAAIADWGLPGVRAMDAQQLTPELAEPLSSAVWRSS